MSSSLPTDDAVRAAAHRLYEGLAAPGLGRAAAIYFTSAEFAGMTFSALGANPPGEITADDLLAVTLLDITWRPEVVRTLLGSGRPALRRLLADLPPDLDLWDAGDDVLGAVDKIWDALTGIEGIGTASATKLLARKRPRLCPVSDNTVIKVVAVPGRTWDVLRYLLRHPNARDRVEALRPAAASEATLLRVLDVTLWVSHSETPAATLVRDQAGVPEP